MGWQSYHHVVVAATPEEAFAAARNRIDETMLDPDRPSGTVLEQDGFEIVTLPALSDLDGREREKARYGEPYARTQAFETRLATQDRGRRHVRGNYRSWIADLGDGTMVVFGWAYAG
jgi:hypothetical protein